jgi:plasmid stabilization system protein ParE
MRFSVQLMPRARRQLDNALRWWRQEQLAAPELLRDELDRLFDNLSVFPELGRPSRIPHRDSWSFRRPK